MTEQREQLRARVALVFTHRMSLWLWISVALLVGLFFISRHSLEVTLFKLALITIGGYVGYLLSLAIEGALGLRNPRPRPHDYMNLAGKAYLEAREQATPAGVDRQLTRGWQYEQMAVQMLWRRAIVVAAVLIAIALGS